VWHERAPPEPVLSEGAEPPWPLDGPDRAANRFRPPTGDLASDLPVRALATLRSYLEVCGKFAVFLRTGV
jgi:hypothetical protein